MRAARLEDGVLQIRDLPASPEPEEGQALIRISAVGGVPLRPAHRAW